MSSTESGESWSQWLDFDQTHITAVPESAGVFGVIGFALLIAG